MPNPAVYGVEDIILALKSRMKEYYFTPKIMTFTVGSAEVGHTFILTFGNVVVSVTSVSGDTTTTLATKIATALKLRWENGLIGDLLIESSGAVVTITGGAHNWTSPVITGTGTLTAATTQDAATRLFHTVRPVPEMDDEDLGRLASDESFALITEDGAQIDQATQGFQTATIHVIIGTRARLEQWDETSFVGTKGILKLARLVTCDLAKNRSFIGDGAPGPLIYFVAAGATGASRRENNSGVLTKQLTFMCYHKYANLSTGT